MKKKIRNAFTVPAQARRNAGAHVHKNPPRDKFSNFPDCKICGITVYDGGEICEYCEQDIEDQEPSDDEDGSFLFLIFPLSFAYHFLHPLEDILVKINLFNI